MPLQFNKFIAKQNSAVTQLKSSSQDVSELLDSKKFLFFALTIIFTLGAYVRLAPALSADFPLNDGGLFYVMIQEIQRSAYHIPLTTSYNGAGIPFAYPPLALELTALFVEITKVPLVDTLRLLPPIISAVTIPIFYVLSQSIFKNKGSALFATLSFALLPEMYHIFIKGGGITRSPGFLLAFAAICAAYFMYTRPTRTSTLLTALFSALTILTHPNAAIFTACSIIIIFLFYGRTRVGLFQSLTVAILTILLTSPWWLTIVHRHGWGVFTAASQLATYDWTWRFGIVALQFTNEPLVPVVTLLAGVGFLICLGKRQFFLPVWFIAMYSIDPRYQMIYITAPIAMLSAEGLRVVSAGIEHSLTSTNSNSLVIASKQRVQFTLISFTFIYILLNGFLFEMRAANVLSPLTVQDRRNLQWIKNHTDNDSRFIVVSESTSAEADPLSEWFPALTGRPNLATIQGSEWQERQHFNVLEKQYMHLQQCYNKDVSCLESWKVPSMADYTHVYVAKPDSVDCCDKLLQSLKHSPRYQLIYESDNAAVFMLDHRYYTQSQMN